MTGRGRRGFWSRWGLPLVAGPAVTVAGLALVLATDEPVGYVIVTGPPAEQRLRSTEAVPEMAPTAMRDVTPPGVTPGPAASGPLMRVVGAYTPPGPAGEAPGGIAGPGPDAAADTPPPPPEPEPDAIFPRVVVLDGQSFRTVRDKTAVVVRLAGITTPTFTDTCTDEAGRTWKCGAKARAELARLIGGRSVACFAVEESDPAAPVMRCAVGRFDLARWLVEQGWADPDPGAPADLGAAAEDARAAKRGRFGPAPSGIIAG